ncbi:Metallophosphoesterase 1 [Globisporangium polare]
MPPVNCSFLSSVDTDALRARTANGSVVLLTHLPLHRADDMLCGAARAREVGHVTYEHPSFKYAPHHHVLSQQLSDTLLAKFDPQVVLSGHTHAWCALSKRHWNGAKEFTIPAFSWGQRPDPSYALLGLRRQEQRRQRVDHSGNPAVEEAQVEVATVVPCSVPSEHSIFALYIFTVAALVVANLRRWCLQWRARKQTMKQA